LRKLGYDDLVCITKVFFLFWTAIFLSFLFLFPPTTDILRMFVGCKPRWDIGCKAFTRLLATKSFEKGGSFGRVREPWIVWKVWKVGSWLIDGSSQFLLNQDTAEAIMARSTREAMIDVGNVWLVMCLICLGWVGLI
jgi:hypothetical protein